MSKSKKLKWLVSLSGLALLGLVVVQILWLWHQVQLREKAFDHRVVMAMDEVLGGLNKDTLLLKSIADFIPADTTLRNLEMALPAAIAQPLTQLIEERFNEFSINTPFEMAFYSKRRNNHFFLKNPEKMVIEKGHKICLRHDLIYQIPASLYIYFPEKKTYIYKDFLIILLATIVCVVIFASCFILVVRMYLNQKRMSEMTKDFINNMTHELKIPIANIGLAANLLKKSAPHGQISKVQSYTDIISDESCKLTLMVERVLESAAMESKDITYQDNLFDVSTWILETAQRFAWLIEEKEGVLKIDVQQKNLQIKGDYTHLSAALSNLLDNAIKYTQTKPEICIQAQAQAGNLFVKIKDNGIGIHAKDIPNLFDPFFRVSTGNIHTVKGFGLGLSYVKSVITHHKGAIEIQSKPQSGTEVTLSIPLPTYSSQ